MSISFNANQFTTIPRVKGNNYNKNQSFVNKQNYIIYEKTDDMLYSGGSGNGMSFTVKYAESSSKENPVAIAKGIDESGKPFEQTFNINDIDPTNASKVEMHALEGHLKLDVGKGLSTLPYESSPMGLNDKADFLSMFKESIDMNLNRGGSRSLGLKHIKNLKFFSDFAKKNALATKSTEELKTTTNVKEELKQSYDIRNSTYKEMCEASQKLLHSGEISLLQHMQMTMDHSRLPSVTKGSPVDNMFNDGQKKDWINIFQGRAKLQLSGGNMNGYNSYINITNILEKSFKS